MALYITVLNVNLDRTSWIAVQWDTSLENLKNNKYYSAFGTLSLDKESSDQTVAQKTVTEVHTLDTAEATVIKTSSGASHFAFASGKPSKALIKKFNLK